MAKSDKIVAKFRIDVKVPFFSYVSRKENKLALLQIKKQIKELLHRRWSFDLEVLPNAPESTGEIKFKVKSETKV